MGKIYLSERQGSLRHDVAKMAELADRLEDERDGLRVQLDEAEREIRDLEALANATERTVLLRRVGDLERLLSCERDDLHAQLEEARGVARRYFEVIRVRLKPDDEDRGAEFECYPWLKE